MSNDDRQGCTRFQALHQWGFLDHKSSGRFYSQLEEAEDRRSRKRYKGCHCWGRFSGNDDCSRQWPALPENPLIYDSHNLCELASKGRFTTFVVSALREMRCSFGIDVEDIHVKRRAHASNNWAVFYTGWGRWWWWGKGWFESHAISGRTHPFPHHHPPGAASVAFHNCIAIIQSQVILLFQLALIIRKRKMLKAW